MQKVSKQRQRQDKIQAQIKAVKQQRLAREQKRAERAQAKEAKKQIREAKKQETAGKREVRRQVVAENMAKRGKVQKTLTFTRTVNGKQYTVTQKRWVKAK